MCEEWQSYSYGTLPPSSGRRCPEGAEVGFRSGMKKRGETFPRFVIPSAAEGSFSLAVRRRVFDSRERETPYRGRTDAVLPLKGLAKGSWEKGTKKISRLRSKWQCEKTAFSLLPPQRDAPKAMCEEWQPYSGDILPPSSGRRCPEGAEVSSQWNEKKWEKTFPRFVIPSAVEGSFSFPVSVFLRNAVCMKHRDPQLFGERCFPLSAPLTAFA